VAQAALQRTMPDPLQSATRTLLGSFRRQRPLRAGSLLVTVFGDAIAPRGGRVALRSLIELAEPFGLTERLVRTSVARLALDDWLTSRRTGRRSEYRLSVNGRRRFSEATLRIYATTPLSWDGRWSVALAASGEARERLRGELKWLGFGEPSAGVFVHPTRSAAATRELLRQIPGSGEMVILEARAGSARENAALAQAGWNLGELAGGYRRLVRAFTPVHRALRARRLRDARLAFVVRTLLIHEYRKVHLRDPLLPANLLPDNWVGNSAYELCRELYARVFALSETYLSRVAGTLEGPLPQPERATFKRFGGLARS
jgi:phenylacetic acid degradation operon negative regulatory protein